MPDIDVNTQGKTLLAIARAAIAREFGVALATRNESRGDENPCARDAEWLQQPGATFVTLLRNGELRGCIGSLEARLPLRDDIEANARAAAFADPRFAPLTVSELNETDIEVSLLSPLQPMTFADEADALAQLRPGRDGVVFEYGAHRSTFLPQVWEQLPQTREFIGHLKAKAGLPVHFWSDKVRLFRYGVSKWKEQDFKD